MRSDGGNFWWVIAISLVFLPSYSLANDAGHSIAAKFAGASGGKGRPSESSTAAAPSHEIKTADRGSAAADTLDERLKADEEAMLERAREEAEHRRASAKTAAEAIVRAARRAKHRRVAAAIAERHSVLAERRAAAEKREAKLAAERRAFAKRLADRREAQRRTAELEEARRIAQAERRKKDEALRKVALAKEEAARAAKKAAELAETLAEERRAKALKATQEREAAEMKERKAQERLAAHEKKRRKIEAQKLAQATAERERENQPEPIEQGSAPGDDVSSETGLKRWEEMKAEREAEARRLSEKLARVRARREGEEKDMDTGYSGLGVDPSTHADKYPRQDDYQDVSRPQETRRNEPDRQETRATILLVMEPGKRGIRRFNKSADPILCLGKTCYVGNGSERQALSMSRRKAFGPANTMGQRAGRCGRSLVCIFRGVEVGRGPFEIQPIDLRIMRHDRRETVKAELDWSCRVIGGSLRCLRPVHSRTYRAWIVPESVARSAGGSAITAAIESNLRDLAGTDPIRKR